MSSNAKNPAGTGVSAPYVSVEDFTDTHDDVNLLDVDEDAVFGEDRCTFSVPVELGDEPLENDAPFRVVRKYARMCARLFFAKRYCLTRNRVSSLLFDTFDPKFSEQDKKITGDPFTLLKKLLSDRHDQSLFTQLMRVWSRSFYDHMDEINWYHFYKIGQLKSLNYASSTEVGAMTSAELNDAYDSFVECASRCLAIMRTRVMDARDFTEDERLFGCSIVKVGFAANDVRMLCILLHDMFDVFRSVLIPVPYFAVDERFFRHRFVQVRSSLFRKRLTFVFRLLHSHEEFSAMRDWMLLRDYSLVPLETQFRVLSTLASESNTRRDTSRWYAVYSCARSSVPFRIHDAVIRYMLKRYFCTIPVDDNETDGEKTEVDNNDLHFAHFFVFLVNKCLPAEDCFDVRHCFELIHDSNFWRCVLCHCATVAPQTFVTQLNFYVLRGEFSIADLLDYVDWLCDDDPWYNVYSCTVIERLRVLSEEKRKEMFSALYDNECILFYLFVRNRYDSRSSKLQQISQSEPMKEFVSAYVNGASRSSLDDTDENFLFLSPRYNWFSMLDSLYQLDVYTCSLSFIFATVREFFSAIVARDPKSGTLLTPKTDSKKYLALCDRIEEIVSERSSKGGKMIKAKTSRSSASSSSSASKNRSKRTNARRDNGIGNNSDDELTFDRNGPNGIASSHSAGSSSSRIDRDSTLDHNDADESNGWPQSCTFVLDWEKTDCQRYSDYANVLQRVMNFCNACCLQFTGSLANLNNASYMQLAKDSIPNMVSNEKNHWNNDVLLRVFHHIFSLFDINKCVDLCDRQKRKVLKQTLGNFMSNNCSGSMNMKFVRIVSSRVNSTGGGSSGFVIWNLVTRRYEIAAPSLLFLITLNSQIWGTTCHELFPNAPDESLSCYSSVVIENVDRFLSVSKAVDSLSMIMYSPLIQKKTIGKWSSDGFDTQDDDLGKRVDSILRDKDEDVSQRRFDDSNDSTTSSSAASNSRDCASASVDRVHDDEDDRFDRMFDRGNARDGLSAFDRDFVPFVIDKQEFFDLSRNVHTHWINSFVRFCLRHRADKAGCSTFLHLMLLVVQLARNPGFVPLLRENTFCGTLIDELLDSPIDEAWLTSRKRKRTTVRSANDVSFKNRTAVKRSRPNDSSRAIGSTEFSSFVEQQLLSVANSTASVGTNVSASPWNSRSETDRSVASSSNYIASSSSATAPSASSTAATLPRNTVVDGSNKRFGVNGEENDFSLFVRDTIDSRDNDARGSVTNNRSDGERNNVWVNALVTGHDMSHRIRRLLRSPVFSAWAATVCRTELTYAHVHQLDDDTIRSVFFAYVYVVRYMSSLKKIDQETTNETTNCEKSANSLSQPTTVGSGDVAVTDDAIKNDAKSLSDRFLSSAASKLSPVLFEFFACRFVVSSSTLALAKGYRRWLDDRIGDRSTSKRDDVGRRSQIYYPYRRAKHSSEIREAIVYYFLMVHIFCDLDVTVTMYTMRLLLSFIYPGNDTRSCVIARGASGCGKSLFFELIRKFLNCGTGGLLLPGAINNSKSSANTEMMPVGLNLIVQIDEPKRVDNETLKLVTSSSGIAARSFHDQNSQTILLVATIVITVNNLFEIDSDDGVLERLHTVYRPSHKHSHLVNKQTDMTRQNCGSSFNLSHQITEAVYPRGAEEAKFLRGMCDFNHHYMFDSTTHPESAFALANFLSDYRTRRLLDLRLDDPVSNDTRSSVGVAFDIDSATTSVVESLFESAMSNNAMRTRENFVSSLNRTRLVDRSTMSILKTHGASIARSFETELYKSKDMFYLQLRRDFVETNLVSKSISDDDFERARTSIVDRVALFPLAASVSEFPRSTNWFELAKSFYDVCGGYELFARDTWSKPLNVDINTLPLKLELNLIDVKAAIDPYVRFKTLFSVENSDEAISTQKLHKELAAFVSMINSETQDAKYRIRLQDFIDRFETEYEKYRQKSRNNVDVVPDKWCVRLRPL